MIILIVYGWATDGVTIHFATIIRLHQPVLNSISDNSNILWNRPSLGINSRQGYPDFSKDYHCLSFKREKIGGHSPTFFGIAYSLRCVKNSQNSV